VVCRRPGDEPPQRRDISSSLPRPPPQVNRSGHGQPGRADPRRPVPPRQRRTWESPPPTPYLSSRIAWTSSRADSGTSPNPPGSRIPGISPKRPSRRRKGLVLAAKRRKPKKTSEMPNNLTFRLFRTSRSLQTASTPRFSPKIRGQNVTLPTLPKYEHAISKAIGTPATP